MVRHFRSSFESDPTMYIYLEVLWGVRRLVQGVQQASFGFGDENALHAMPISKVNCIGRIDKTRVMSSVSVNVQLHAQLQKAGSEDIAIGDGNDARKCA